MRVLVTRPRDEGELFAVALAMRGHDAILAPLIEIAPIAGASVDLSGAQAVLFTSANGVRAFARVSPARDLPAFCVGDATANAARAAGFAKVESASGDVEALSALVRSRLKPADGALVHAAGTVVAGDLGGDLEAAGFEVRRALLYRAEIASELPAEAADELAAGGIDVATFFSPRTARTFAQLVRAAKLDGALESVAALALAPGTLSVLREEGCAFADAVAAAQPNEAALLDALDRFAEEPSVPPKPATPKFELPPPEAPEPRAKPAKAPRPAALVPLATALVVAVVGVLGWVYWQNSITGGTEPGLRAVEQRLSAVDRRIAQIEARPAAAAAPRVDLAPLEARLAALEGRAPTAPAPADLGDLPARLAALEARPAQDPATQAALAALMSENRRLADELARVQAEIGRLQGGIVEQTNDRLGLRRAELRLAAAQLRDALAAGRPFAGELSLVRDIAGEAAPAAEIAALSTAAKDGVETRASLAKRFPALANNAVAAARAEQVQGPLGELIERAQGFLSIRRIGDVPGDSPAARVARAELRLAADDLAGAVGELEGIQSAAWAAPLLPWIDAARRRLAAERAAAALSVATGG
ncbi:MAG: uroporphyrinogen-III synthase [Rhodospirillales bacterium]|nr:uroporphyrinogen-III synthase [Rhodospirillales bacterium]